MLQLPVDALAGQDQSEVLAFLARRAIHTVFMAGLIRDNGVVSLHNRGTFYGYRNKAGILEGVALIGLKTVIEARSEMAFRAFARLTLANSGEHLMRGEHGQIERLVSYLSGHGRPPRLINHEVLLEQTTPARDVEAVPALRQATRADLEQVIAINAAMAFEEHGVNPLTRDAQGVCRRVLQRLEQGREWVLTEDGRIIFKADIISATPEVIFIEGVFVHPEKRGRGYGLRCMTQLARNLLTRTSSLCLVVKEENRAAQRLYYKAGYQLHSHYRTVYF
ncbi:MAG TPA: GNAT family N-acetyltransferase [Pyrinomonadaceae bacterium]